LEQSGRIQKRGNHKYPAGDRVPERGKEVDQNEYQVKIEWSGAGYYTAAELSSEKQYEESNENQDVISANAAFPEANENELEGENTPERYCVEVVVGPVPEIAQYPSAP
jgi:hypothetical protein